jgi:hypothetical protein
VIHHTDVAHEYTNLIKRLGVETSEMKSQTSKDTYQFTKRWFQGGVEITGIPVRGFALNISKVHFISMNLKALYQRGFTRVAMRPSRVSLTS